MRLVAHVMIFLFAGVALLHGALATMGGQKMVMSAWQGPVSGSVVIYKTSPARPLLRRVRDGHTVAPLPECRMGFCQDV